MNLSRTGSIARLSGLFPLGLPVILTLHSFGQKKTAQRELPSFCAVIFFTASCIRCRAKNYVHDRSTPLPLFVLMPLLYHPKFYPTQNL